jgi:flavin reductase (DIM6/NTAB) family NADH-FMN oxidoreductase RutF
MAVPTNRGTDPAEIAAEKMRFVLGRFCSGVVVVTSMGADGPVGFTCQSFASLSLDPPLVSFFASHGSKTWPRIRSVGWFCVNILASGHEEISGRFAVSGADKFAGVAWRPAPSGAPVLDDVCAWVDCTLEAEYPGGDHDIVVGRVRSLDASDDVLPLVFYRGGYRSLR